jgi:hypothetical protein
MTANEVEKEFWLVPTFGGTGLSMGVSVARIWA